jgi:hypothetical protein
VIRVVIGATLLLLTGVALRAQLTGSVLSESGQPIADALVATQEFNPGGGYGRVEAHTDAEGRFHLEHSGKVVFVRQQGFKPLSYVLHDGESTLQLTLQRLTPADTLNLPSCSQMYQVKDPATPWKPAAPKGMVIYGFLHKFAVSKKVSARHKFDVDYGTHEFAYPGNKKEKLLAYSGAMWGGYYPDIDLFKNSVSFSERLVNTGEDTEEIRGTLANGHKWRWMGGATDEISYYDVSPQAAEYFDRIIDRVCMISYPLSPPRT